MAGRFLGISNNQHGGCTVPMVGTSSSTNARNHTYTGVVHLAHNCAQDHWPLLAYGVTLWDREDIGIARRPGGLVLVDRCRAL